MDAAAPSPDRIVLFDGVCAVCDAAVQWILDHDPEGRFRFAPLQGETAAAVRARHPELPPSLDSLVLVTREGEQERVTWYADGVLDVLVGLGGAWRWLGRAGKLVPRPLRDLGYRAFAAVRYRVFGRLEACRVPRPEELERFLP